MSRYLCCACCTRGRAARDSNTPAVALSTSPLHDLVNNPTPLNQDVERKLAEWQKAIFDFENTEVQLLMRMPSEAPAIVAQLHQNPVPFAKHTNELVRTLAQQRLEVLRIEGLLPSKQPSGAQQSRPSMTARGDADDLDGSDHPQMGYFTERLSQIWSTRLNNIDLTQGALSLLKQGSDRGAADRADVFVRPKWPDFLADVSYDVIKVNKYGHQMRRILKLTQNHVVSIKNGNEVTKFYHYLDIRRVGLRRGDSIFVLQRSGKRNVYLSPIAPHILQQLTTRVQVRRSLDRAFVGGSADVDGLGFDVKSAAEIIRAIAEENVNNGDSVMTHFATNLRERTIRSLSVELRGGQVPLPPPPPTASPEKSRRTDEQASVGVSHSAPFVSITATDESSTARGAGQYESSSEAVDADSDDERPPSHDLDGEGVRGGDNDLAKEGEVQEVLSEMIEQLAEGDESAEEACDPPPIVYEDTSPRVISTKKRTDSANSDGGSTRTPMLIAFPDNTPEHAVQEAVRKVIFDSSTPEGNTRKAFVEKFRGYSLTTTATTTAMVEIRHFIDGMHEHIVFSRAYSLAILYQQQRQKAMAQKNGDVALPSLPTGLEALVRGQGGEQKFMRRRSLKLLKESNLGPSDLDEELLTTISYIVFVVVEEATFLSLKEQIISLIQQSKGYDEESTAVQKVKYFSRRTQAQWGVPQELISPLGWRSASFELSSIEHNLTPTYQLQVLSRTIKAIYNEFKHAVLPRMGDKAGNVFLGADDLVPIFIYVFCKANLRFPVRNRDLMWALCHPDQLHGEGGYYLTVYESAIDFVLRENIEAENFLSPEEEHGGRLTSSQERSTDVGASISGFITNLLKYTGAVETDGSMSMRESFA